MSSPSADTAPTPEVGTIETPHETDHADEPSDGRRQLTVVMPVYNEEASLLACASSWLSVLTELGIDHRVVILDDGSSDNTSSVLAELSASPAVEGVTKTNEGHGPTILRGYREAVKTSEWVFQVDSDDEIPASSFPALWDARHEADAVLGRRTGRDQTPDRRIISRVARLTIRLLYKSRITDANVPFRLMRADVLAPILDQIPDDTFAPNIVISGALGGSGARVVELPVPFETRQAGEVSIVGLGAVKAAVRSFVQSVRLARTFR